MWGEIGIHSLQWTDSSLIVVGFCGVFSFTRGKKNNLSQCLIYPLGYKRAFGVYPRDIVVETLIKEFQRGSEALDQLQVHWVA